MRDHHPDEFRQTIQQAGDITQFFPGSKDGVQRENIILAFAANALPYQVAAAFLALSFGNLVSLP